MLFLAPIDIATSVDQFLTQIGTDAQEDEKLYLGFTFSFPVLQTALGAGTLINWTKVRLFFVLLLPSPS